MDIILITGMSGSGKSVGLNTMILSLLYRMSPEQCRLIMIDPKRLELGMYEEIPHLLTPVVVEPKKAANALRWAVREMEERYKTLAAEGVRQAKSMTADVEFSPEDASRTEPEFLAEVVQAAIEAAVDECDRFYPVFQFILWGDKSPADALASALVDAVGEA